MCIYDDRNSVFRAISDVQFEDLGANRNMGKNLSAKMSYLELPTLICLFSMQLLWGCDDD